MAAEYMIIARDGHPDKKSVYEARPSGKNGGKGYGMLECWPDVIIVEDKNLSLPEAQEFAKPAIENKIIKAGNSPSAGSKVRIDIDTSLIKYDEVTVADSVMPAVNSEDVFIVDKSVDYIIVNTLKYDYVNPNISFKIVKYERKYEFDFEDTSKLSAEDLNKIKTEEWFLPSIDSSTKLTDKTV